MTGRSFGAVIAAAAFLVAACGGDEGSSSRTGSVLASGKLELPAAQAFGEPGFHELLGVEGEIPASVSGEEGTRIVLALRDAGRPEQTCDSEHPLSGCATVDWSDDESRPNVPPGGVFENSVRLDLESGERTFFLSESGGLALEPDPFKPG